MMVSCHEMMVSCHEMTISCHEMTTLQLVKNHFFSHKYYEFLFITAKVVKGKDEFPMILGLGKLYVMKRGGKKKVLTLLTILRIDIGRVRISPL